MEYKRYGKTEYSLSALTFGAMRIPFKEEGCSKKKREANERNAIETIRAAADLGINHIDTARGYGNSERLVGLGFQEVGRDRFVLTTKIGANTSREDTRRQIDEACGRMQTDHIEIVDVHGINSPESARKTLGESGCARGIHDAIDEGIVSHAAFSSHGEPELIRQTIDSGMFAAVSLLYWYTYQRHAETVAYARKKDLGVLILSPSEKSGMLYDAPEKLRQTCAPHNPLVLAHRWLLSQPAVTTLAIGARNPEDFAAHMPAVENGLALTGSEKAALARWESHQREALGNTFCSICFKCMPCPQDVAIAEILRLRNLAKAYDMKEFGRMRYNLLGNAGDWFPGRQSPACTRCGYCIPRCPLQLNIPELLNETHELLIGKKRKRLW
ncbi:MAG: aldo/keto reductase [Fibrobacterota bacterium]